VSPATGITDADGIASAQWTLANTAIWPPGTAVATVQAWATVAGTGDLPRFGVTVIPGPPVAIVKEWGDVQIVGAAAVFGFVPLVARATDQFGNPAPSAQFEWRVVAGPVVLDGAPMPQGWLGASFARVRGTGQSGTARVEVEIAGTPIVETYALQVVAGEGAVALFNPSYTTVAFLSHQNRSTPAVDTLPIGGTMVWKFQDDWDVVSGALQLVWTGAQGFPNCPVHGEPEVFCRVTFSTPGTYSYTLSGPPFATGTIVVMP
jgi:hypothetical protein